jgi:hypothetical protein
MMGAEQHNHGNWDRIRELANKLDSHYAEMVFVAKEYTKADLRRDLLAAMSGDDNRVPKTKTANVFGGG